MIRHPLERISLGSIPPEGSTELSGKVALSDLDIADDDRVSGPNAVAFSFSFSRVSGRVLARGRISTILRCRCDSCLTYYDNLVVLSDLCYYVEPIHDEYIDLTEPVREDILLAFPQRSLCKPDCLGLCPRCGQNLNVRPCGCDREDGDASPWHALDGIDLDESASGV